jgi:hypothetical protein
MPLLRMMHNIRQLLGTGILILEGIRMKRLCIGLNFTGGSIASCLVLIGLLNGCALVSHQENEEAMYMKASALTKLSAAVEATVRYDSLSSSMSDQELLNLSTEDDPSLLEPFNDYLLKINRDFNHAIVMMCSKNGMQGLLEDAGCTAAMDHHLWQKQASCVFTLSSDVVCHE